MVSKPLKKFKIFTMNKYCPLELQDVLSLSKILHMTHFKTWLQKMLKLRKINLHHIASLILCEGIQYFKVTKKLVIKFVNNQIDYSQKLSLSII